MNLIGLQNTLNHDGGNDYTLNEGESSVWITVDDVSVYIQRKPLGGVLVELYEIGNEFEGIVSSCSSYT